MPYESISELPKSVRNLPGRAKTLYMKAFNSAWEENDEIQDASREKVSHETAWSAVKLEYEKDEETGEWVKTGEDTGKRSRHAQRHRRTKTGGPASQAKAHA